MTSQEFTTLHRLVETEIIEFLLDEFDEENAKRTAKQMADDIIKLLECCSKVMSGQKSIDIRELTKHFHTLKSLLTYADLYYESDLCADIEFELREKSEITESAVNIFNEIISSLKETIEN